MAGVPNMRHIKPNLSLSEVEGFFKQHKYSDKEAQKFFYYNQGKNWMLTEKLPITDWQSIAHKWILNSKSSNSIVTPLAEKPVSAQDIQYLYERFLDGAQISR